MKKGDLARLLARKERISRAAARDEVDRVIHKLALGLKQGKALKIPGLGAWRERSGKP